MTLKQSLSIRRMNRGNSIVPGGPSLSTSMTIESLTSETEADDDIDRRSLLSRTLTALSPRNVSSLYVLAAFLIVFAIWIPNLFYTSSTMKQLLSQQAVTGIAALAFLVPFTTLNFDLTVGSLIGVSSLLTGWLMVNEGIPVLLAIPISILFCALIGSITGTLITKLRISSIIATIAMMSIIDALGSAANGGNQILYLPNFFLALTSFELFGIAMPFWYLIFIAVIVWFILTHTPAGRYLYAIGGGEEAARLAGVQVMRLVFLTYLASAVLAAIAGIIVASKVGAGDYSVGDAYLFTAASAMFFGSTQVKPGTFNVWGTVLAVYVLGAIVEGLELGGAPFWVPNVADGVALLIAVGLGSARPKIRSAVS